MGPVNTGGRRTAEIVSAHIGNNAVKGGDVPALIQSVFETLAALGAWDAAPATLTPAVPIRWSVTEDYIVCLEDGRKLKMSGSGFIHIDLGPARSWGERFPKRATAFVVEAPPAREVLADSRTLKGGGAAGIATIGAAGVEVAQEVLAETQGSILPLVPYLDTLRWAFIAAALAGIAVAIYARPDDWKRGIL